MIIEIEIKTTEELEYLIGFKGLDFLISQSKNYSKIFNKYEKEICNFWYSKGDEPIYNILSKSSIFFSE